MRFQFYMRGFIEQRSIREREENVFRRPSQLLRGGRQLGFGRRRRGRGGGKRPEDDSEAEKNGADKLPSPDSLFKSVGRPSFLADPNDKFIDWDRFVKASSEPDEETGVHDGDGYAAIPPPASLATGGGRVTSKLTRTILGTGNDTAVEYSSPPVTYNNGPVSSERGAPVEKSVGETGVNQAVKPGQEGKRASEKPGAPPAKRAKGELFRIKEKRKRDIGQTSRGKSYVEEEKENS